MVSFNQGDFIEESILSVINQDYPNLEFILIDGGSTDNTLNIISKYKNKIDYYVTEKDFGLYHARNKGLLKATGDYIGFLNTDDTYRKDSLLTIGRFFSDSPDVDLVYGTAARITKEGEITNYFGDFEFDKENYLKYSQTIPDQSTFFRKECLAYIGLFDTSLKFGGDTDLWKRFAKYNLKIVHINKHIGNWRIYNETLSYNLKYRWQRALEAIRVQRRYVRTYFNYVTIKVLINYFRLVFREKKWARNLYFLFKNNK